jgi:hypothetical protein
VIEPKKRYHCFRGEKKEKTILEMKNESFPNRDGELDKSINELLFFVKIKSIE